MKSLIVWLLPVAMAAGILSCKDHGKMSLPPCIGKPGEVVLVLADALNNGPVGDTLRAILMQEEPDLPQTGMDGAESMFDLIRIPPSAFTNLIKPSRNIVEVDAGSHIPKSGIAASKNYWADGQIYIRMEAPGPDSIMKLILDNRQNLINILREGEVDRQMEFAMKYRNVNLGDQILARHQIIASLPKGYQVRVDTGNFVWTQYDPAEATFGVFFWSYPYINESQLEYSSLMDLTNRFLKPRVPGPQKGSYMTIEQQAPVSTRNLTVNGNFVRELRGLWQTEGAFMGGPFISWNFIDEKRNRMVTAFGFVYSPNTGKRNNIRKIEGILRTVDFPD